MCEPGVFAQGADVARLLILQPLEHDGFGSRERQYQARFAVRAVARQLHAVLLRQMHHRRIFAEAMDDYLAHRAVAQMHGGTGEQRIADAHTACAVQHRKTQFRAVIAIRNMHHADRAQFVIGHGKNTVVLEIDSLYVVDNRLVR